MSFSLDQATLAAITQEARQCFLEEDAPEYLETLEEGLRQRNDSPDFISLLRAAHSLKGGAGLAELFSLKELAHKLEDILEALQEGVVTDRFAGWELVERSVAEIAFLLDRANVGQDVEVSAELLEALGAFAGSKPEAVASEGTVLEDPDSNLAEDALKDLEASFASIEELPTDAPDILVVQCLESFCNECLFLGETLDLPWLIEGMETLEANLANSQPDDILVIARETISSLRKKRDKYLESLGVPASKSEPQQSTTVGSEEEAVLATKRIIETSLTQDLEASFAEIEELPADVPEVIVIGCLENLCDECLFLGETLELPWLIERIQILQNTIDSQTDDILEVAKDAISSLRKKRDRYLNTLGLSTYFSGSKESNNTSIEENADLATKTIIETSLTEELEANFAEIEELPTDIPEVLLNQYVDNLCDECLFLGETLDLPWLIKESETLQNTLENSQPDELLFIAKNTINSLKKQRNEYLESQNLPAALPPSSSEYSLSRRADGSKIPNQGIIETSLTQELEASFAEIEELPTDIPDALVLQCLEKFCDEGLFLGETLDLSWLIEGIETLKATIEKSGAENVLALGKKAIASLRKQRNQYLAGQSPASDEKSPQKVTTTKVSNQNKTSELSHIRVPLSRLENMSNNVGELILSQQRLRRQQKQLKQLVKRLRKLARQFEPVRDEVQNFYDRLAMGQLPSISPSNLGITGEESTHDFDPMELDSFTSIHTGLQTFQELMVQVNETRADLSSIERDLTEDLEQFEKNLDGLYTDVTESRLVPFKVVAKRFVPQIQNLNRRYGKSVNLEIEGLDVLVDQVLLEQLQIPLTHLLNNAFDHGIEVPEERKANQKPETAQIVLAARVESNLLAITLRDDGRGINLQKVYQRALERGLISGEKSIDEYSQEEIIHWIFQPDFSTAAKVSELSGRGMGLDIVKSQIRKLRGTLEVETQLGFGTIFTLKLSLNLSLVPLLLVQLTNRMVAIPSTSVKESVLTTELDWLDRSIPTVKWRCLEVPVVTLSSLLPTPKVQAKEGQQRVGIVLDTGDGTVMVTVDSLLSEGELIVKPFDDTVPTPSYLAGCTILGTGEVVPVIFPRSFKVASSKSKSPGKQLKIHKTTYIPTILVAEDSVATRRLLEKIINKIGYNPLLCRDGQEALEKFYQYHSQIEMIISDVEMPRMNGFELVEKLRSDPNLRPVPIVMATSRTGAHHRQQAMHLGANAYLGKPISPQELLATIQSLIATG